MHTWELQQGSEACAIVRSRARDCSYSSQEFVRYLSLQQLTPEPSILTLHCSTLDPCLFQSIAWHLRPLRNSTFDIPTRFVPRGSPRSQPRALGSHRARE